MKLPAVPFPFAAFPFAVSMILAAFLLLWPRPALPQDSPTELPVITLTAGMYLVRAEVAANDGDRQKGLMFRPSLGANQGMVFVFDAPASYCMWMRNTLIPLSVAFLDDAGRIINIADMQPKSEQHHCAARPALYALEMNLGWFAKRGMRAGMRIGGLPGSIPGSSSRPSP